MTAPNRRMLLRDEKFPLGSPHPSQLSQDLGGNAKCALSAKWKNTRVIKNWRDDVISSRNLKLVIDTMTWQS